MSVVGTNLTLCSVVLFAAGSQDSWDVSDPTRTLANCCSTRFSLVYQDQASAGMPFWLRRSGPIPRQPL